MLTAVDATVVRPPLSGVHYAVRQETLALLRAANAGDWAVLATDPSLREATTAAGAVAPPLPVTLRHVWRRIAWQQLQLPGTLRHLGADRLLALAYTAPLRSRVPTLLHVHDTIALRRPELCSTLNAWHMRTLMPPSIRRAAAIVVSADPVRGQLLRLTDATPATVHVVPMGVDPLFLQPPPSPLPPAIANLHRYLLVVGTIEPKKGIDILLTAYEQVARRFPEVALVLAGRTGWKVGRLKRRIESWRNPGQILHLGYVDRRLLPALYTGAAAYVMPSTEEGFGLPILEAMACGTPVVHSDHPVLRATAGGHAIATPTNDPLSLAQALIRLLADPHTHAATATAARAHAHTRTWDQWAKAVLAIADTL